MPVRLADSLLRLSRSLPIKWASCTIKMRVWVPLAIIHESVYAPTNMHSFCIEHRKANSRLREGRVL